MAHTDEQAHQPVADLDTRPADLDEPWGESPAFDADDSSVPVRFIDLDTPEVVNQMTLEQYIDEEVAAAYDRAYGYDDADPDLEPMVPVEVTSERSLEQRLEDHEINTHRLIDVMYDDMDDEFSAVWRQLELAESLSIEEIDTRIKATIADVRDDLNRQIDYQDAYLDGRLANMTDHIYDLDHAVSGVDLRLQETADKVADHDAVVTDLDEDNRRLSRSLARTRALAVDALDLCRTLASHVTELQDKVRTLEERQTSQLSLINSAFGSTANAIGVSYIEIERVEEESKRMVEELERRVGDRFANHGGSLYRVWREANLLRTREESARNQINYLTDEQKRIEADLMARIETRIEPVEAETERIGHTLDALLS